MSPTLKKLAQRTALLAAVGIVLSQMLPSLADQLTPNPVQEIPAVESSAQPSPETSESPSSVPMSTSSAEPVADITYLPNETPTAKAKVIDSDSLFFRVPTSLKADPRATSIRMDSFALGGADDILICATSNRAQLTLSSISGVEVDGQGTRSLLLSGSPQKILAALTAGQGLTLMTGSRVAGSNVVFQVAAVSKPSANPELCGASQITRSVAVTALGIDLNTVKTPVKIGKK